MRVAKKDADELARWMESACNDGAADLRLLIGNGVSRVSLLPRAEYLSAWCFAKYLSGSSEEKRERILGDYLKDHETYLERRGTVLAAASKDIDNVRDTLTPADVDRIVWRWYETRRSDTASLPDSLAPWEYAELLPALHRSGALRLIVSTNYDAYLNRCLEPQTDVVINPCLSATALGQCPSRATRKFRDRPQRNAVEVFKTHGCLTYVRKWSGGSIHSLGLGEEPPASLSEGWASGYRHFIDYNGFSKSVYEPEIKGANRALCRPTAGKPVIMMILGYGSFLQPGHEQSEEAILPLIRFAEGDPSLRWVLIVRNPGEANRLWHHLPTIVDPSNILRFDAAVREVLEPAVRNLKAYWLR